MSIEIKLRELISESLGVSDDLYDFVNGNVIPLLIEDIKQKKNEFVTQDGLKQFNNKVDIVFCGKKIHIYYTFYGFLDNIRYNRYRGEHGDIFSNATSVFSDKNRELYGGNIDNFIKKYKIASNCFLRKIGRVIVKVRDGYMNEGIIFTMNPTLTRDKLYLL